MSSLFKTFNFYELLCIKNSWVLPQFKLTKIYLMVNKMPWYHLVFNRNQYKLSAEICYFHCALFLCNCILQRHHAGHHEGNICCHQWAIASRMKRNRRCEKYSVVLNMLLKWHEIKNIGSSKVRRKDVGARNV